MSDNELKHNKGIEFIVKRGAALGQRPKGHAIVLLVEKS